MATADTVKNQIQALIDTANQTTGKADADLTAAVGSLMEGYGIGSDPVLTELTITENGEYLPGEGVDGFSKVYANIHNELIEMMSTAPLYSGVTLPDDLEIDLTGFPNLVSIMNMLSASTCKNVVLRLPSGKITNIQQCFYNSTAVEVTIYGEFNTSVNSVGFFAKCGNLERINSILPASFLGSAGNYYNVFMGCGALKRVRFSANGKGGSDVRMNWSDVLEDESIVSIANALIAQTDTSYTLSLNTTPKARCDEILGTVSTVTDGDASYDFFTMDEAGTVTLTEFITTVKGWTLA